MTAPVPDDERGSERGPAPITCMHGAPPGLCPFQPCPHFVPDGPRDERWAFRPGTSPEDISAALAENEAQHARAPGSASPIHLVVERWRLARLEGYKPCPTCKGAGHVRSEAVENVKP